MHLSKTFFSILHAMDMSIDRDWGESFRNRNTKEVNFLTVFKLHFVCDSWVRALRRILSFWTESQLAIVIIINVA